MLYVFVERLKSMACSTTELWLIEPRPGSQNIKLHDEALVLLVMAT